MPKINTQTLLLFLILVVQLVALYRAESGSTALRAVDAVREDIIARSEAAKAKLAAIQKEKDRYLSDE